MAHPLERVFADNVGMQRGGDGTLRPLRARRQVGRLAASDGRSVVMDYEAIGRKLQAEYTAKLRASGVELRPLTEDELAVWHTGAPMPQFSHICMDRETVVGADAR
jgi:hypothetical protein